VQTSDRTTWTLVQPTARRREWQLRDPSGAVALLRIPIFRSGAEMEIGDRRLRIERRGGLRSRYAVVDESTGGEVARLYPEGRQRLLELDGLAYRWQRLGKSFGFVADDGEALVAARVRSGLARSSGEIMANADADERRALLAALLACYLLIRRNEQAAASAGGTVAATTGA
jgi:hypothetical protein